MFGLDERIAASSYGASFWIVLTVAVLLRLRHATDPDHLAAVTTLVASGKDRAARTAGALRLAWGVGHATTLFIFGLPILLLHRYLPERIQQGAETAVGLVIAYLALRLLVRWRRGTLYESRLHVQERGDEPGTGTSPRASMTLWTRAGSSGRRRRRRS